MSKIPTNGPPRNGDGGRPVHSEALPPDVLDAKLEALRSALLREVAETVRQASEAALKEHTATKPLLSIKDVAKTLGVSKRTCETLLAADELPPPLYIGSQRRWHPDTISAYLRTAGSVRR